MTILVSLVSDEELDLEHMIYDAGETYPTTMYCPTCGETLYLTEVLNLTPDEVITVALLQGCRTPHDGTAPTMEEIHHATQIAEILMGISDVDSGSDPKPTGDTE